MFSVIIAVDENYGFSFQNKIPWHCKEDLLHFKKITDNQHVIMGKNTWESIPQNIFRKNKKCTVLTHNSKYTSTVDIAHNINSLDSGIIIGGKDIILQMIGKVQHIYLTIIKGIYEADIFFNEIKDILIDFKLVSSVETNSATYFLYCRHE